MAHIRKEECRMCRQDRASRARVALTAQDPRFKQAQFVDAPAVFPNNDVKYDTNKLRAEEFAAHHRIPLTYAAASEPTGGGPARTQAGRALQAGAEIACGRNPGEVRTRCGRGAREAAEEASGRKDDRCGARRSAAHLGGLRTPLAAARA